MSHSSAHRTFRDVRKPPHTSSALQSIGPSQVHLCASRDPPHGGQSITIPLTHTAHTELPLHGGRSSSTGSPAFTVIKNDSIDRFVCCLLIYSDSFMGTAGWVPAGPPHCPPAANSPRGRGTHGSQGCPHFSEGAALRPEARA